MAGRLPLQRQSVQGVLVALVREHVEVLAHSSAHQLRLVEFLGAEEGAPSASPPITHRPLGQRGAAHLTQGPTRTQNKIQ